ncbi:hypothetical protein AAHB33_14590 [Paenarthrobacter sp. S56]|uniref:hypothetical protein n=1 Tax=Paenarthrobacter sp. S56 TaxID=3138179 RepID=UPI00321BC987
MAYLVYYLVQRNKNQKDRQPVGPNFSTAAPAPASYGTGTNPPAPGAGTGTNTGVPVYGAGVSGGSAAGGSTGSGTPPYGTTPPYGPTPPVGGQQKPARPKRNGPGAAIIAVSTGAALVAGGTLKALDAGNVIELGHSANPVVFAAGAAVLGLGILVAGLRGADFRFPRIPGHCRPGDWRHLQRRSEGRRALHLP